MQLNWFKKISLEHNPEWSLDWHKTCTGPVLSQKCQKFTSAMAREFVGLPQGHVPAFIGQIWFCIIKTPRPVQAFGKGITGASQGVGRWIMGSLQEEWPGGTRMGMWRDDEIRINYPYSELCSSQPQFHFGYETGQLVFPLQCGLGLALAFFGYGFIS